MTKLDIIKEKVEFLDEQTNHDPDFAEHFDAIVEAASRMAARIEGLEKQLQSVLTEKLGLKHRLIIATGSVGITCGECENFEKCKSEEGMTENDTCTWGIRKDFKNRIAELEKRPNVVFCGQCTECKILKDGTHICFRWQKRSVLAIDYCSDGVRKESEGK